MASAALALILAAAVLLPPSAPGCIAAMTVVPPGTVSSGQTVTFTDGTLVNPATRFLSRQWSFGDGSTAVSARADQVDATHAYVNRTARPMTVTVRLTERTGLGSCSTTASFTVSPQSM